MCVFFFLCFMYENRVCKTVFHNQRLPDPIWSSIGIGFLILTWLTNRKFPDSTSRRSLMRFSYCFLLERLHRWIFLLVSRLSSPPATWLQTVEWSFRNGGSMAPGNDRLIWKPLRLTDVEVFFSPPKRWNSEKYLTALANILIQPSSTAVWSPELRPSQQFFHCSLMQLIILNKNKD